MAQDVLPKNFLKLSNYSLLEIIRNSDENYTFYYVNKFNNNSIAKIVTGTGRKYNRNNIKLVDITKNNFVIEKLINESPYLAGRNVSIL